MSINLNNTEHHKLNNKFIWVITLLYLQSCEDGEEESKLSTKKFHEIHNANDLIDPIAYGRV